MQAVRPCHSGPDHVDYRVSGHLHHPHGDHCDDHGPLASAQRRTPLAPSSRRLLTAHAQFAARPERNARELSKRLREAAVFVAWLIEQTATVERVRRRAERRRDLLARLIQPGSGPGVIRPRGGTSGKGGGRAHDRCKSHNSRSWDQPSTTSSGPQGKHPSPFPQPATGGEGCGAGQGWLPGGD